MYVSKRIFNDMKNSDMKFDQFLDRVAYCQIILDSHCDGVDYLHLVWFYFLSDYSSFYNQKELPFAVFSMTCSGKKWMEWTFLNVSGYLWISPSIFLENVNTLQCNFLCLCIFNHRFINNPPLNYILKTKPHLCTIWIL